MTNLHEQPEFIERYNHCVKVSESFEYFLDQFVFIEDKEKKTAVKLELYPSQRAILPDITGCLLLFILKAQQLGLTWLVAAYVLWLGITNELFLSVVISVTETLSVEFLDRVKFIMDRLPRWLYPKVKTRTQQELSFVTLVDNSGIRSELESTIKSLPTTEMGAQSKTPNVLVMDETCKNRMAQSIYNASYAGIKQAKGQIICISNAIKEGDGWAWTMGTYKDSMHGLNDFKRIFLSWRAHPGRSDNFRLECKRANMTDREISERFPESEQEALAERHIKGVYYAKQLEQARKDGRITCVPYNSAFEVYTTWDLGVDDSTAIWFYQIIGLSFRFIRYYENTGMGLEHYAQYFKETEYNFGDHYMPHDAAVREMSSAKIAISRAEVAEKMGIRPVVTVQRPRDSQSIMDGIEATRNILSQCWFDEDNCAIGLDGLGGYRSEYDESTQKFGLHPAKTWHIHSADSFRTFVVGHAQGMVKTKRGGEQKIVRHGTWRTR